MSDISASACVFSPCIRLIVYDLMKETQRNYDERTINELFHKGAWAGNCPNLTMRSCVNSIQSISINFFQILKRCGMKQHLFITDNASIFFYYSFAFHVVQFINFLILYSFNRDNLILGSFAECCFNILVFLTVTGQFEFVIFSFICCFNPVRWNLKQ